MRFISSESKEHLMKLVSCHIRTILWRGLFGVLLSILFSGHVSAEALSRDIDVRIVGGTEAEPGAWPWMVSLARAGQTDLYYGHYCGGSLIHSRWVVTAGHCAENRTAADIDVVVGVHDLKNDAGERIGVKRIVMHPDYNSLTLDADIALLELVSSVSAEPLPLADPNNSLTGMLAITIGWGSIDADGWTYPTRLQQVSLPVISNETCNKAFNEYGGFNYDNPISDTMLCAGYSDGGKDACVGDSGGPLIVWEGNGWKLAGVVSWGEGCAMPDLYGVYTRVGTFVDFIRSYVKEDPLWGQLTTAFAGHEGLGVANAVVTVQETGDTARTNVSGYFSFNVPPGSYTIRIEAPGLITVTKKISLFRSSDQIDLSSQMNIPPAGDFTRNGKIDAGDAVGILQTISGVRGP